MTYGRLALGLIAALLAGGCTPPEKRVQREIEAAFDQYYAQFARAMERVSIDVVSVDGERKFRYVVQYRLKVGHVMAVATDNEFKESPFAKLGGGLNRLRDVLGGKYPVYAIAPEGTLVEFTNAATERLAFRIPLAVG